MPVARRDLIDRRTLLSAALACAAGCAETCRSNSPALAAPGDEPGTLFHPGASSGLPRVRFVEPPPWLASAGALYCPAPRTAGSALLHFAEPRLALSNRLRSFRELPALLDEANALGTNIIYLVDWYEGRSDLSPENYCWNKGDYDVRTDLGGEDAFIEGIRALHERGGRILLYLEPFAVEKGSRLGRGEASRWAIRTREGFPEEPYPDAWKMCPSCSSWVDHLATVAVRVVERYGADGLHLDSYGYQRGWACIETSHGHPPGDADLFESGCKALVQRLHEEITARNPAAAILTEGPRIAGLFRWASASQEWGIGALCERWIWEAAGSVPVFTSGWNIEDLYQIVALGHRLSLGGDHWSGPPRMSLSEAFASLLPSGRVPDRKDERFRRFFAEDWFRVLHQHRNARLLMRLGAPNVDRAAPRRWDRPESFGSQAALAALFEEGIALASRTDAGPSPLSPAPRIAALVSARSRVSPLLRASHPSVLVAPTPHCAGYRHDSPAGSVISWVNVGATPAEIELPPHPAGGRWQEHVTQQPHPAGPFVLPPHEVFVFGSS